MSVLEIRGLVGGYGRIPVLHKVELSVDEGQCVTVIGANGAGKSTLLRTISGINRPFDGEIRFDGQVINKWSPSKIVAAGVAHVPENRRIFPALSVTGNLRLGAYRRRRHRREIDADTERMMEHFPILGERRQQLAGTLSGGQQQMLAIAMALMSRPRLLMLDEPSLGLAPIIVEQVFKEIGRLRMEGTTILLVEQLALRALEVADHGVVLRLGEVLRTGPASELLHDDDVRRAYLGTG